MLPFDLHVLGMPPAFNLSQDQTLHLSFRQPEGRLSFRSVEPQPLKLITDFLWVGRLHCLDRSSTRQRKASTQFTCAHCQRSRHRGAFPLWDISSR